MTRTPIWKWAVAALAAATAPIIMPPGPASAGSYTPPATIDRTGITDVTAQLLSYIASVPDNSTISFPANASYRIEGSLKIQDRKNLTFEGNGARFSAKTPGDRARRHFWFVGGSNIVVRNLTVVGANPFAGTSDAAYDSTKEAQHAFEFDGVVGGELSNVTATDVYGDFVYFGMNQATSTWATHMWVHDSVFARNGRQGMSITAGNDIVIERNSISDVRRATFDLEPNGETWGATNVTIRNNDIGAGRLLLLAVGGRPGAVDNVNVTGNTLTGKPMNVSVLTPAGSRRSGFTIANNTSDAVFGSPQALMTFTGVDGVTVTGNYQRLQAGRDMVAVKASTSCAISVHDNVFPNVAVNSSVEPYGPCATVEPTGTGTGTSGGTLGGSGTSSTPSGTSSSPAPTTTTTVPPTASPSPTTTSPSPTTTSPSPTTTSPSTTSTTVRSAAGSASGATKPATSNAPATTVKPSTLGAAGSPTGTMTRIAPIVSLP